VFSLIVAIALGAWFLVSLFSPGDPAPLPRYVPFINPLDLEEAFSIAALMAYLVCIRQDLLLSRNAAVFDTMLFLWLTAIAGRSAHFFLGVPYGGALFGFAPYQLMLLVLWGVYGIAHMLLARRTGERRLWIAGAVLTLIDIAKLLLIDLAGSGAITRIVSFFVAGAFLLFIGWAAPLPGKKDAPEEKDA
jgi:uncharacterized membrane protein